MNSIMAVFWLILGLGIFVWPLVDERAPRPTILNTGLSIGWLCLFFAAYNALRSFLTYRARLDEAKWRAIRTLRDKDDDNRERDPAFDFSDDRIKK